MRPVHVEPEPGQESVWDYPRPPALVPDGRRVLITFADEVVADTTRALKILETSHPPTWYLPLADVDRGCLRAAEGASFCEWKGAASYVDVVVGGRVAAEAGWYYPEPAPAYADLVDHVAFYAGRLDEVTVDGVPVEAQPGGFYGGWITPEVVGPFKGGPDSMGW